MAGGAASVLHQASFGRLVCSRNNPGWYSVIRQQVLNRERLVAVDPFQELTMNFVAFERAKQGTGASRRLRISGRTPGIVYGGSAEPQLIEVDHNALWHALKKEAFHSSVLDMELNGKTSKVLLRDAIPPLQATGAAHRLPARGRKRPNCT